MWKTRWTYCSHAGEQQVADLWAPRAHYRHAPADCSSISAETGTWSSVYCLCTEALDPATGRHQTCFSCDHFEINTQTYLSSIACVRVWVVCLCTVCLQMFLSKAVDSSKWWKILYIDLHRSCKCGFHMDLPSLEEIHIVKFVQLHRKLHSALYFRHHLFHHLQGDTERTRTSI